MSTGMVVLVCLTLLFSQLEQLLLHAFSWSAPLLGKSVHILPYVLHQSSVAEWLRRWANLAVITTTELLGGRGFESYSRHE